MFSVGFKSQVKKNYSFIFLVISIHKRGIYLQYGLHKLQGGSGWVSNYNAIQNQHSHY